MFNEGLLKSLIKIGIEKGVILSILLAPTPLSISVLWSHSWCSLGIALWRGKTQRWWGYGKCCSQLPTPLDLARKQFPCWLKQLLCDPNQTGDWTQQPCLKAGHAAGWKSALRGHKACLGDGQVLEVTQGFACLLFLFKEERPLPSHYSMWN